MIEVCPHCGADVLFAADDNACPRCHKSSRPAQRRPAIAQEQDQPYEVRAQTRLEALHLHLPVPLSADAIENVLVNRLQDGTTVRRAGERRIELYANPLRGAAVVVKAAGYHIEAIPLLPFLDARSWPRVLLTLACTLLPLAIAAWYAVASGWPWAPLAVVLAVYWPLFFLRHPVSGDFARRAIKLLRIELLEGKSSIAAGAAAEAEREDAS